MTPKANMAAPPAVGSTALIGLQHQQCQGGGVASHAQQHEQLRQALAISIIKAKRTREREAAEWRQKAQRLEQQLKQQQCATQELQQWARGLLSQPVPRRGCSGGGSGGSDVGTHGEQSAAAELVVLPPLGAGPPAAVQQLPLQLQVGLDSKAASLASMLLTNVRMMQLLHASPSGARSGSGAGGAAAAAEAGGSAPDAAAMVCGFVGDVLISIPPSSLRAAYISHCAQLLAQLLLPPGQAFQPEPIPLHAGASRFVGSAPPAAATATPGAYYCR